MSLDPAPERTDATARTLQWIALGALALGVLSLLGDVLLVLFAASLLAVVMLSASRFVARHTGCNRRIALGLLLAIVLAAAAAFVWIGGGDIVARAGTLAAHLQDRLSQLEQALSGTSWGDQVTGRVKEYVSGGHIAGIASGLATSTLGLVGTLVVLAASSIYMALSPRMYQDGALRLLPIPWRPRGREVTDALGETLAWWFLGQLVDMLVVGALTYAGLLALGAPLAGTLALIAALFNFVPYVGALAGAVPAVLVALGQSSELAVEVAVLFLIVQTLEGNVIAPLLQRRTVELPPLLTILSQTVFGTLFGIGGLVLATPLAAALLVFVRMVYVEDVLDDHAAAGVADDGAGLRTGTAAGRAAEAGTAAAR